MIVDHAAVAGTGITAGKTLHGIDEAFVIEDASGNRQFFFVEVKPQ